MTMLNPALAALLKTAQMATPQGTPTVAQGIAKLAMAQAQATPPALPEVADNVQAALPTMERNAQQAQMEQIANMVAQRMAPESSGIAQLPVGGGEYAEGGVVGYNGQEDSYVDTALLRKTPEAYERARQAAMLRGATEPRRPASKRTPEEELIFSFLDKPPVVELPVPDIEIAGQERGKEMRYPPRFPDTVTTKPRPGPGASSAAAAPAPASAVGAPATGKDPLAELQKLATRGEYKGDAPTLAEQINLANQARWARGLTGGVGEGLEKLVQDLRAEQARLGTEREKSLKGRPLENLIQSFAAARTGGLGGLGRTYANLQSAQRAEQERFNALQYERKIALAKMDADKEAMREAAARGDKDGYDKAMQSWTADRREYDKTTTDIQLALARNKVDMAGIASREREGALDREAQERIARGNNATQKAIADARKEGKNPYDTVVDNVRAEFAEWAKNPINALKPPAEQNAAYQAIYQRHLQVAKQFGLNVPATSAAPTGAPGTAANPIKLD